MKKKKLAPAMSNIIWAILKQRKLKKPKYIVGGGKMSEAEFEKAINHL